MSAIKSKILEQVYGMGSRSRGLRISTTYKSSNTLETWSFLRFVNLNREETTHQNNYFDEEEEKEEEEEGRRRTLLLLLRTARRRTTLSIFCAREREDFSKKKPFVVS